MEAVSSNAAVYLHPSGRVLEVMDDLEGMYLKNESKWFRITDVNIARRKLLNNAIDNIYCSLEKVAGPPGVFS